jgi:hypothetical protein
VSVKTLAARLAKLTSPDGPCRDPRPTAIVSPGEPVPDDAQRCPRCNAVHVLVCEDVVVEAPQQSLPQPAGGAVCPNAPPAGV